MARRISRRRQNELLIHKWWFNLIAALVLLAIASTLLSFARGSDSVLEYIVAAVLILFGAERAIQSVR